MIRTVRSFFRSMDAATAAEFTLIFPVLTLFLLGTIDVGRLMWTWNQAEKATQMGARWAAATDYVEQGIKNQNFVGSGSLTQGDPIPASAQSSIRCTSSAAAVTSATLTCTCPAPGTTAGTAGCPTTSPSVTAFSAITRRITTIVPQVDDRNVWVTYAPSGLGFAGDPNGAQSAPLVTVELTGATFKPLIFQLLGTAALPLPSFKSSLTMEDGSCPVIAGNPACVSN